jgi:glycosyltransferase involved in cell wall biosynthesis
MIGKTQASIAYVRDSFPYPPIRVRRTIPFVLEVNSIQDNEMIKASRYKKTLYQIFAKRYYKFWDAHIFVTSEIKEFLYRRYGLGAIGSTSVITNGIQLSRIQLLPASNRQNLNFLFVGQPGLAWNGISDILELAGRMPYANFHIVGEERPSPVPKNVKFYGYLASSEYVKIAAGCHVALGTMGVSEKGMTEGCSLKTREYLAMGMPVIIRYVDVDFIGADCTFIYQLPMDEKPIVSFIDEIVTFSEKWKSNRVDRRAIMQIDIHVKEKERLNFFSQILG